MQSQSLGTTAVWVPFEEGRNDHKTDAHTEESCESIKKLGTAGSG